MISSTLYDVVAIVGLLIDGDKLPFLHDIISDDLNFKVTKRNSAYSTFITSFNKGKGPWKIYSIKASSYVGSTIFFLCTSSIAVIGEVIMYVNASSTGAIPI